MDAISLKYYHIYKIKNKKIICVYFLLHDLLNSFVICLNVYYTKKVL